MGEGKSEPRAFLAWGDKSIVLTGALALRAERYLENFEGPWRALAVQRVVDARLHDEAIPHG
jgi:hypothetical protein